jgi:Putative prokaryotic signal transducing protein
MTHTEVAAIASSTVEAQLIAGMLEANGITARVSADDAGGQEPQWQLTDGVRVIVASDDLAEARRLISESGG